MKILTLMLVIPVAANADILSDSSSFLGNSSPDYSPEALVPEDAGDDPSRAPFSPGDSDFGVQQVLGRYDGPPPVRFDLGLNLSYTDNAPGRVRALDEPSFFFAGYLAASWRPRIACGWFADIGISEEFFRFEDDSAVDFENFRPYLGVVKSFTDLDDLVFYSRYEYQRLTTGSWSDSGYSAHRIRGGLQKTLFARSSQQLAAGVSAAFDLDANPRRLERDGYAAELSYTYWFFDRLSATASYEATYWDFGNDSREDWNQIVGVELDWQLWRHGVVYTNLYYSNHDSNSPLGANDFEAWQTGIGFGFNHSF